MSLLLDRLDANDAKRFRDRRTTDRHPFRRFDVSARYAHPGGSRGATTVTTRNLSKSGIGLLVDRFLHIGTRIELDLHRTVDQAPDRVTGRVVFCTHVRGAFHQIGVRFDHDLFVALYVDGGL